MSKLPAFNVRAYPSFRPARLFRVVFTPETVYFLRMRGLIGQADAGGDFHLNRNQAAIADLIRTWAGKTIASGVEEIDRGDPEEILKASKKNFRVKPEDFTSSSLEPAAILGGHGAHFARWKFALKDGRKMTVQVEDSEDLKAAVAYLPRFLGSTQVVKVRWDEERACVVMNPGG